MTARGRRILAGAVVMTGSLATGAARATAASAPVASTPIQHLVVMAQDHHSFDNYFGTRSGVDGIPPGVCLPEKPGSPTPCVKPFPIATSGLHLSLRSTNSVQETAIDRGRMDGFVYAQSVHTAAGHMAMGYYRPQDIPVLTDIADQAVLFDHWFSSVPAGTVANRLFAVSGVSQPADEIVPANGWGDVPLIFDRLQAAGVSWRVYVENLEPTLTVATAGSKERAGGQVARVPVLASPRFTTEAGLADHVADLSRYYADLANGTLPAVSYIVTTSTTERPPSTPAAGQVVTRHVLDSLAESTAWDSSAFVLYYDSAGGWYDHVAPPSQDGAELGPRVPALLVSPYAAPDTVDHATFDSASILKFIESNWSLRPLTSRDRDAANLVGAFSFGQAPRPPAVVGGGGAQPVVVRPLSWLIYLSYTAALATVGVGIVWMMASRRRRWHTVGRAQ